MPLVPAAVALIPLVAPPPLREILVPVFAS